jgi:hypothetical protein
LSRNGASADHNNHTLLLQNIDRIRHQSAVQHCATTPLILGQYDGVVVEGAERRSVSFETVGLQKRRVVAFAGACMFSLRRRSRNRLSNTERGIGNVRHKSAIVVIRGDRDDAPAAIRPIVGQYQQQVNLTD